MQTFILTAIEKALREEVTCAPKAGLVCPNSKGAHRDMDYALFLKSISAIMPFFQEALVLFETCEELPEEAFSLLRKLGIRAEAAMLEATGGVNTHKGAVFSFLILSAAAMICANRKELHAETLCRVAAKIANPALQDFAQKATSKGMALYERLGILGIRGEAASGFASVLQYGLPVLQEELQRGESANNAYVKTLTSLMSFCADTNILSRSGEEGLAFVQKRAKEILTFSGEELIQAHEELNTELIAQNISPGGCADMLGITIFLYEVTVLDRVLEDREKRYHARLELAKSTQQTVVSVTMCAPIAFRGNSEYAPVFKGFIKELEHFFSARKLALVLARLEQGADGIFALYRVKDEAKKVKKLCIEAEGLISKGRIFDVDVMNQGGESLSRSDVGVSARSCLICAKDAATCTSRKRHSKEQVAQAVLKILEEK